MGLQLPGELIEALSWLGMTWPEADEELLLERGNHWLEFARQGGDQRELANDAVATMLARNDSPGLQRFSGTWDRVGGDWGHLHGSTVTADAVAAAYFACAAVVLAMKLAVIVQLVALAVVIVAAIAAAIETLGASLAAAAAYARTIFTAIQRIVAAAIQAIATYGPKLAGVVGSLLAFGTYVLDARPVHSSPTGQDGAESDADRRRRERAEQERHDDLAKDPAKGGKSGPGSRREADVALGCEANGSVPGPVTRATDPAADFTDGNQQDWDVKKFYSTSPPGQRGDYDPATVQGQIQDQIDHHENVILDLRDLSPTHRADLIAMVRSNPDWAGKVVTY